MSIIQSSAEHLTLNADGSSKDIKFQANGVEKASIDSSGNLTVSGNLTSVGIDDNADATAITINSSEQVGIGTTNPSGQLDIQTANGAGILKTTATTGTNACYGQFSNTGGGFIIGRDNSSGGILGGGVYASHLYSQGAYPLVFSTNSVKRMSIDATGAVTMPSQPSFRAYKTATNTGGGLDWNGTYHNTGSHFNASTGKFTAPVDGVYLVTLYYLTDNNSDQSTVYASINGNADNGLKMRNAASSGHETTSVSGAMYLSANDYITPSFGGNGYIYGDSSKSWTQFSAHLLG